MSKDPKCPCCGAHALEAHDADCALAAYVASHNMNGYAVAVSGTKVQPFSEPGYHLLAEVLERAYNQAAIGKGKERHANGEAFENQVMQDGARRFGVGSLLFQAFKKSEESQRLPLERGVNELLGAIVYLAGAVIAREREAQS